MDKDWELDAVANSSLITYISSPEMHAEVDAYAVCLRPVRFESKNVDTR